MYVGREYKIIEHNETHILIRNKRGGQICVARSLAIDNNTFLIKELDVSEIPKRESPQIELKL